MASSKGSGNTKTKGTARGAKGGRSRRTASGKSSPTRRQGARQGTRRGASRGSGASRRGWRARLFGWGMRGLLIAVAIGLPLLGAWAWYLNERVTERFEGALFTMPATVYAAPDEIYVGQSTDIDSLTAALERLNYVAADSLEETGTFRRRGNQVSFHRRSFAFPDGEQPSRRVDVRVVGGQVTELDGPGGESLGIVRLEPRSIGTLYPNRAEDRVLLAIEEVQEEAPLLLDTLLAVEDRAFHDHYGVVPTAILRAFLTNLVSGERVQGGSTITQQLAKNLFLTHERTYRRKFAEMIMALEMEWHYPKEKILEAYLNEVYLGQDGGRAIHGFGLAASFYFGRPINELRPEQVALLVGMVKGANYYNPRRNPERALARRNVVIDVMIELGLVDQTTGGEWQSRPLGVLETAGSRARHPAFVDLVRRQLTEQYDPDDLKTRGLNIFTTLRPRVQEALEQSTARLDEVEASRGLEAGTLETAGVIASVSTGEIEAMIGGRDTHYEGYDRALDARRQIGSLIKPAIYLTALSRPADYNLITPLADEPITVEQRGSEDWQPNNYSNEFHGPTPLIEALAHSRNVPSVRLGMAVGLESVAETIERLGGPRPSPFYPSMLLGSMGMTPFEVAQMYQTLSADGFMTPLRAIRSVVDRDGQPLSRYSLDVRRAADREPLYLLQYGLQTVVAEGTSTRLNQMIPPSVGVAGKTGTTNDGRDAWFAGFTGNRVGVIWVGRDDDRPANLTGSTAALPLWGATFAGLDNQPRDMTPPRGVRFARVDPERQFVVPDRCPGEALPFIAAHRPEPAADCDGGRQDGEGAGTIWDWFR
ncbi:penicillin-binding protein 1B [Guyparkeria halophila]|uniref:Penicillin-binding protein 1B n=1 Tax=Guyparkeria halophila TaxID=47960 RepID=A0ABZ0YUM7_9GAMM|nr:penicillin-binding protein 1B [Guyparkeria halophila]WQH15884.1 penicillin-binding protein 1B [Guyparkeria halophila]